jgi:MATE family multidrug resistance protein
MGVGFMALTACLMLFAPRLMIGVFLDRSDPGNTEVIELAVVFLVFAAIFQLADGAQAVASGMLRGLQDTRVPMLIAAFGYWGVGLPLGVVLAFRWGSPGRASGSASPLAWRSSPS